MMLKLLSVGCSSVMMMRMWKQVGSYRFCSHSDEVSGFIFLTKLTFTVLNIPSLFCFIDLKLGIIDMYLRRLKERQHRKK